MFPESSKEITSSSFQNEQPCRHITFDEIKAATGNFRPDLKLGEGGFGNVFKGNLSNEAVSIIRTIVSKSGRNLPELLVEIVRLANFQHPNVVRFIGYCHADIYMFFVFEYIHPGTLGDHLHRIPRTPLSWLQRLKICIDVARALNYLHSGKSGQNFIPGQVKSSRILLDVQLTAKFAVLEILSNETTLSNPFKGVVGTYGYGAPEYIATGHKFKKSDVYSFGVILLEVICRRPAVDMSLDKRKQHLATWAQRYLNKGKLNRIIDPELKGQIPQKSLNDYAQIVECCLHADPQSRSTMVEVLVSLESLLALQEKTDINSIPQLGKTTSDMSLRKLFSSSKLSSAGVHLRKVIKFLPSKSPKHKDHAISDVSFQLKKRLKHKLVVSNKKITSSLFENEQLFRQFTFDEIKAATRNFGQDEKLGEARFGKVFMGNLNNEVVVVIKLPFASDSGRNFPELLVEIERLANFQHPNVVRFIGYCHADIFVFFVFEYMPPGTLGDHLHRIPRTPLSWLQRLKICIDAARALNYLHSGKSGQNFIPGQVKSSRILLDVQLTAKFAVLEILSNQTNLSAPLRGVVGTYGYGAPEYISTGHKYKKSDVYSFGVILLEVLCRRPAVDRSLEKRQQHLAGWAQQYLNKGELKKIIDPELKGQMSQKCLIDYAKIVECCLHADPRSRSTMAEVLVGLESILDKTTSDLSLGKHISSSGLNSEEGYFKKAVKLMSSKSLKHKDHVNISNDELKPPSDPNRKFIDDEVLSTSQTESSRDLIRSNYLQRAYIMTRRKDFLQLMWFYPVKKEAEVSFGSLLDKFSSLNKYIRMSLDPSTDTSFPIEIQILLQDIEEYVDDAAFDMVPYLPEDLVQNWSRTVEFQNLTIGANFESFWSGIPEIHESSVGSAIYRALKCIKDLNIKMIGIWGNGAEEVTATLRDLPELKSAFDIVLFVRTKHHTSIEYLMNDIEQEIDQWKKRRSRTLNKIDVLSQLPNCLLFVDCSGGFFDLHEHQFHLSKWFQNMQIVMTSGSQISFWQVELEIRVQDHRLPWNIFLKNVDIATMGEDSRFKQLAVRMVEKCDGHLLAIILLARTLRDVVEIGVWELALQELVSSSQSGVITDVMVRVLRFVWPRMETVSQQCIIQFALQYTGAEFEISSLINCWITSGVFKSETEAQYTFEDLERLFLIERVAEKFVRMRDETRIALLGHFIPRTHGLYLKQDGSKSNEMPSIEEWDVREIHLTNNILSELPDNPKCPILIDLFLHSNQDLMDVPITFFDNMPSLQVLDLSSTSLKTLPSSISMLTTLRKLFIRNCDLMMELPPEIGSLKHLKVFDSEGTQLICLPEQVGSLTRLECLKFSLYNFPDNYKRSNQNVQMIPVAELSKLVHLKELSICVDMYGEGWENEVKLIIKVLCKLRNLNSLSIYFPTTELFCMFIEQKSWEGVPIYQHLTNFKFIVGHLKQRLISRLPFDLDKMFVKLPKCLKFTSTEGEIEVISSAMKQANAFFLDRHWTAQSLSAFGLEEMKNLKFCLLVECSEMVEIVNGSYLEDFSQGPVLGSLEYISIHCMKSLRCIWNGPIRYGCLSYLKTLVIHACPELRTIFTQGLLDNLTHLENIAVEDCPILSSLVSLESDYSTSTQFLPRLKKISLVNLPELVSISNGTSIAPRLESLVVYDCPNLEKLSRMEVCDHVKEIKGENEWWDGLKWCQPEWTSGQPEYLARVFIPLGTDDDIMAELADAVNFLPHVQSFDFTK